MVGIRLIERGHGRVLERHGGSAGCDHWPAMLLGNSTRDDVSEMDVIITADRKWWGIPERILVLEQLNSSGALGRPDVFGIIIGSSSRHGRACNPSVFVAIVVPVIPIRTIVVILDNSSKHFDLAVEDHSEPFTAHGLFDAREPSTVAPFVEFAAESIAVSFEEFELARGEEAMPPGSVDMGD
jgi:hypothetical protein